MGRGKVAKSVETSEIGQSGPVKRVFSQPLILKGFRVPAHILHRSFLLVFLLQTPSVCND